MNSPGSADEEIIDEQEGIGYIRMTGFQKSTPDEMEAALNRLSAEGMKSLIWDLRGNPGGLLTAAVTVCDQFLREGRIVSTRGRASSRPPSSTRRSSTPASTSRRTASR